MHKTVAEAVATVQQLQELVKSVTAREVAVCPPATALYAVGQALQTSGSRIALGAQDLFWEEKGAYTGLISPAMLKDAGCKYVIIGHSERRGRFGKPDHSVTPEMMSVFGDNDATVNRKLKAALTAGLRPILCVGETFQERLANWTDLIIRGQLARAFFGLPTERLAEIVVAYEPVWAIGTGEACEPAEANRVLGQMRKIVKQEWGEALAGEVRLLYGGSVEEKNAGVIMEQAEIDGVLVGGASLDAGRFARIVTAGLSPA